MTAFAPLQITQILLLCNSAFYFIKPGHWLGWSPGNKCKMIRVRRVGNLFKG